MSCGMWRWTATNPTNEMFSGTFSLSAAVELTLPCSLRRCPLNSNSFIQLCTSMGMSMSRDRNSEMVGDWRLENWIHNLHIEVSFRISDSWQRPTMFYKMDKCCAMNVVRLGRKILDIRFEPTATTLDIEHPMHLALSCRIGNVRFRWKCHEEIT